MASFFLEIFNLSMAACWIIGAVFAVRMLFVKSMPKWLVCCLWGLVAIRLLIPVTVESNISLVPNQQLELYIPSEDVGENSVFIEESVPTKEEIVNDPTVKVPITNETVSSPVIDEAVSSPVTDESVSAPVTDEAVSAPVTDENISFPEQNTVIGDQNNVQNGINENGNIQNNVQVQSTVRKNQISVSFVGIAAIVWAVGFCIMTLYSVLSYILLKRRVRMSFPCGDKVRKGEGIDSPFVLGFLRPRIYIPFGLSQRTEECVIAHERAHLARRDYIIKPLAFLILSVHWFNPFVWVAYILLCRDIEYACDERVVKGLDTDARKAYAFALLECAISHRRIAACPVAFGETGVKERVKNTMKYKKPAFWIIVICVIVCITVAVLFLTTGVSESDNSDTSSDVSDTSSGTSDNEENGVYAQVDSFINEGKFEEAYKLLLTVKSEQKAKDMLKDFLVVCETESQYGRGNNGTGLIDEFKTEYDANGNPVKITKLGSNRDIQTVTQMSYDKDNNLLTKDIYYSGAETPKIRIKYTYDENGWLVKELRADCSENGINYDEMLEYVYDSHGNVVEKRTTNYFGFATVKVVRYVLKYDEKGRLIEKYNEEEPEYVTYYSYYDDGTLKKEESEGWLKEYDENGNIVKSDTGDEKDDYVYNADGKLLKHTCDDGKSVTVYEYTYDENGYLVKKTADSDEYGVTTWQYYNDAYGNPEKMALTYDSGKDDGYIYHYSGYKYFYRPQKKSEGNSEKNPNDSVQKDYIDNLFAAEFVKYKDLGKYENCVRFVSDKEYNVMSVLITPKTTIYDFRIYSLVDNIDNVTLENILFEAKSISADKPLLAEIEFADILAVNGISFTDENGNEYLYKLTDSPYDGSLVVSETKAADIEETKTVEFKELQYFSKLKGVDYQNHPILGKDKPKTYLVKSYDEYRDLRSRMEVFDYRAYANSYRPSLSLDRGYFDGRAWVVTLITAESSHYEFKLRQVTCEDGTVNVDIGYATPGTGTGRYLVMSIIAEVDLSAVEDAESINVTFTECEYNDMVTREPFLKSHETPEKLSEVSGAWESVIKIYPMNAESMRAYSDLDDINFRIKKAGLKIWITDPNGNKIDYIYTNSDGVAAFSAPDGYYKFYLEGDDTYVTSDFSDIIPIPSEGYNYLTTKEAKVRTYRKEIDSFTVYVTDVDTGEPIKDVAVRAFGKDCDPVYTDSDGKATTRSLLSKYYGYNCDIYFAHDKYDDIEVEVNVKDREMHVQMKKTEMMEFTIKVIDFETGEPVEGVEVLSTWFKYPESKALNKVTGKDGLIKGVMSKNESEYHHHNRITLRYLSNENDPYPDNKYVSNWIDIDADSDQFEIVMCIKVLENGNIVLVTEEFAKG
ncbi:MAG: hypothetical protein IKY21_03570 [Clostridia bacterium]|nr:hypothetical protein [Clostridia bacterium]